MSMIDLGDDQFARADAITAVYPYPWDRAQTCVLLQDGERITTRLQPREVLDLIAGYQTGLRHPDCMYCGKPLTMRVSGDTGSRTFWHVECRARNVGRGRWSGGTQG